MNPRDYARYVILTLSLGVVLTGLLTWLVDPYAVLHDSTWPGFNRYKTDLDRRADLFKAHLVDTRHPEIVILGNSRAEVGFSANHPAFGNARVVNFSLTRASFPEIYRFYQYAVLHAPVRQVVTSIDIQSLRETDVRASLQDAGIGRDFSSWHARWQLLKIHLSYDALEDAVLTIIHQAEPARAALHGEDLGGRNEEYMSEEVRRGGGSRRLSHAYIDLEEIPQDISSAKARVSRNLELMRKMGTDACRRGIALKFVSPPIHTEILRAWERSYGDDFLPWLLKETVRAVDSAANDCPAPRPEIWSALDYTPVTTEPLPSPSAGRQLMRNYWEVIHFRQEVGNAVLNDMFRIPNTSVTHATRLSLDSIDAYLATLSAKRSVFRGHRVQ